MPPVYGVILLLSIIRLEEQNNDKPDRLGSRIERLGGGRLPVARRIRPGGDGRVAPGCGRWVQPAWSRRGGNRRRTVWYPRIRHHQDYGEQAARLRIRVWPLLHAL